MSAGKPQTFVVNPDVLLVGIIMKVGKVAKLTLVGEPFVHSTPVFLEEWFSSCGEVTLIAHKYSTLMLHSFVFLQVSFGPTFKGTLIAQLINSFMIHSHMNF